MPAAAVIPAPIAYIKVVAVKKLVVEFLVRIVGLALSVSTRLFFPSLGRTHMALICCVMYPYRLL